MPMTMKKIESEALNLDIHSRASLVGKLLLSLGRHFGHRWGGYLLYKAVNTMDSLFGYKNECYLAFGGRCC